MFVVNLLDSYVMHSIVTWLGDAILWIRDAFVTNTLVSIFMVLLFAPLLLTVYLMLYTEDGFGGKGYAKQDKFIRRSVMLWIGSILILFMVGIYTSESFSNLFSAYHNDYLMPLYFIIGFMVIIGFLLYTSTQYVNSENIDQLLLAEEKAMKVIDYSSVSSDKKKAVSKSFRTLVELK